MGFHNPFLKDGQLRFPDNGSVVRHVEKWAKVRGDKIAYRFVDFSTSEVFGRYVAQIWGDLREEASRGLRDDEKYKLEHHQ